MESSGRPSEPRVIATEDLLQSPRFRVQRCQYSLPDGSLHSRELIQHPGAVVILPVDADGRICLIKNYRPAIDKILIELPAGTREQGEPVIATARRELEEETGLRAGTLEPLSDFFMSPGILNEHMHSFVATDLTATEQALDDGEHIVKLWADPPTIIRWIYSGSIQDAKTLAVLLLFFGRSQ